MPKSVYIIASQSASEDKDTGLLSVHELVEKIQIAKVDPKPGDTILVQWRPMRVYAAWIQEKDDKADQEYEFEFRLLLPPDRRAVPIGGSTFRFRENFPLIRMPLQFDRPLPLEQSGWLWIENRIRKVGTQEWQSQEYPIIVEYSQSPEPGEPPPA